MLLQESLDSPIDRRSDYYRQRAREERPSGVLQQKSSQAQPLLTAPNALTFLRVLLVPVLVVLWFHPHQLAPLLAAITFIVAAITDWTDGYLARRVITSAPPSVLVHCMHYPRLCSPSSLAVPAPRQQDDACPLLALQDAPYFRGRRVL